MGPTLTNMLAYKMLAYKRRGGGWLSSIHILKEMLQFREKLAISYLVFCKRNNFVMSRNYLNWIRGLEEISHNKSVFPK